jgi:mannose-6-phosphate isomerase-like protein (cupin superfamily)
MTEHKTVVNLHAALATFEKMWSPRIVTTVNDYDVRIAKVQGEYVWHSHQNTDEFFMVLDGELSIGLRAEEGEREVTLGLGDVYVVPCGQQHRPVSHKGASILLFEMSGTLTTGDFSGSVPSYIDSTSGHNLVG